MSNRGECAASYLCPGFNGNPMEIHETMAPPAVNDLARQSICEKKVDQCSNKNGRGKRCPRPAWNGFRRCERCHKSNQRSLKRNFLSRMVIHNRNRDHGKGFRWAPGEYVTRDWLLARLDAQGPICYWCGKGNLDTKKRLTDNGIQLERLSNKLPHLKRNCVFACGHCNRRSWRAKWDVTPHHLRRVEGSIDPRLTHKAKVIQDRVCLELSSRFGSTA